MDIIFLRNIALYTFIGYYDWEQQRQSKLHLDLEIALPKQDQPLTDRLEQTIDYDVLLKKLQNALLTKRFLLIEALAEYIAKIILEEFQSPWTKVAITKLGVLPKHGQVGILIERGKK